MNMWVSYILHVPCNTTISFALPFSYALIGLRGICSLLIGSWEICTWQHRLGTARWSAFGVSKVLVLCDGIAQEDFHPHCVLDDGMLLGRRSSSNHRNLFLPVVNGELRINPAPLVAKSPPLLGRNGHRYAEDLNFRVGNTFTHLASVLNLITEFDLDTMLPRLCLCDPLLYGHRHCVASGTRVLMPGRVIVKEMRDPFSFLSTKYGSPHLTFIVPKSFPMEFPKMPTWLSCHSVPYHQCLSNLSQDEMQLRVLRTLHIIYRSVQWLTLQV